jgi:hypothetical protein
VLRGRHSVLEAFGYRLITISGWIASPANTRHRIRRAPLAPHIIQEEVGDIIIRSIAKDEDFVSVQEHEIDCIREIVVVVVDEGILVD